MRQDSSSLFFSLESVKEKNKIVFGVLALIITLYKPIFSEENSKIDYSKDVNYSEKTPFNFNGTHDFKGNVNIESDDGSYNGMGQYGAYANKKSTVNIADGKKLKL